MVDKQEAMPDFEAAMQQLTVLVQRMESGELSLEETLKEFEQGIYLTRVCQDFLQKAEQRVRLLDREGVEHPLAVDHKQ